MPANTRGSVRVLSLADATLKSADAAKQDWVLARLGSRRASSSHVGQLARRSQLVDVDNQSADEASFTRSSSSSTAASHENAADRPQTCRGQHEVARRSSVRACATVPKQQSSHKLADSASKGFVSSPDSIGFGGQGVSHGALSNALKTLGSTRQTRECKDIRTSAQQHHAVRHIGGNTVMSCVSASHDSAPESSGTLDVTEMYSMPDPLIEECTQIMHFFGMDDVWFEGDFLPYAQSAVSLGPHRD